MRSNVATLIVPGGSHGKMKRGPFIKLGMRRHSSSVPLAGDAPEKPLWNMQRVASEHDDVHLGVAAVLNKVVGDRNAANGAIRIAPA